MHICSFAFATGLSSFILSSAGFSSSAYAAIVVTKATVTHEFSGLSEFGSTTSPLVDDSPGNHFTTYDGKAGATLDIGDTAGSLRLDTWGRSNSPIWPGYSFLLPSGKIQFTVTDGDFTATTSGRATGFTAATYTITQLSTGLSREIRSAWAVSPTSTGPLAFPAPAGDYELTFTTGQNYMLGSTTPGRSVLDFAITPEPGSAALIGSTAVMIRRRRGAAIQWGAVLKVRKRWGTPHPMCARC